MVNKDEVIQESKKYWMKQMSGEIVKVGFPGDYCLTEKEKRNVVESEFFVKDELTHFLINMSNNSDQRLHMILFTSVAILLFKYSHMEDNIIGSTIYKQREEFEYINTILPIRYSIDDEKTFKEELLEIRRILIEAVRYQNYSIRKLIVDLSIHSSDQFFPLFDIGVILENVQEKKYMDELKINILFSFCRNGEDLKCKILFNNNLYTKDTIIRLFKHFEQVLICVKDNVDIAIKDIDIIADEEREEILFRFNETKSTYPREKRISQLFEEQVEKTPDIVAVECGDKNITYGQLNKSANALAARLREEGIGANDIVGIYCERSIELFIGILGILKAGGAYLPIDTIYPAERIRYMLEDSRAKLLLVSNGYDENINLNLKKILLSESFATDKMYPNLQSISNMEDLCYIIYTSGSTGKPKGVMVNNRGVVNYVWWASKVYLANHKFDMPLFTSISFDLTVTTIFLPIITGNRVIIYREEKESLLKEIVQDNRVGLIKLTPVHLSLLGRYNLSKSTIKRIIVGGEDLKTSLAKDISIAFNDKVEIFNEYGPTETVVGCMIYKYNSEKDRGDSVPIGVPADNTEIYILNKNLQPVPFRCMGEIYIGGDGVAKGYLNMKDKTEETFIRNPFMEEGILYKTGDLAKMSANLCIEYCGRVDNQVKIRGYRIELGEIENELLRFPIISETAVIVHGEGTEKSIWGYIVAQEEVSIENIKNSLAQRIPEYMIPSRIIQLEKMPLTQNGKIDRKALMEIEGEVTCPDNYVPPRNEIDEKIIEIWSDELYVKNIGINDDFFSVGGNSIKALIITEKINNALNCQLEIGDMFDNPTIKELTDNILDVDSVHHRPILKLSPEHEKNIFLFPPMAGLGIAYKDLASKIKDYTVYAFDFIENENRREEYINIMTDIQTDGPFFLMAFSSGGILLYDIAQKLEERNYEIAAIILIDSVSEKKVFSDTEREELIAKEVAALKGAMIQKYPTRWKYVEDSIKRRIQSFLTYISKVHIDSKLGTDIHILLCDDKDLSKEIEISKSNWKNITKKKYLEYKGRGKHIEMMVKYLDDNSVTINEILESYK